MSQRKLKKGIEEQKSATINAIKKVIEGKTDVSKYNTDGVAISVSHCQYYAIEEIIKNHDDNINHLKKKYQCDE